jgi:hypothetical protein
MEKISKHISYKEAVRSSTAKRLGIENTPTEFDLKRMKSISENIFEPLREAVNGPIRVNSFFRSKELNKAVGGSAKSQHCKGQAADIEIHGVSNYDLAKWIQKNTDFDQVILEFYTPGVPDSGWVHVTYNIAGNRGKALTASKVDGRTHYSLGLNK